jgi:hypothetical protein
MAFLVGCLAVIAVALGLAAVLGFALMLTWNAVVPVVFGGPTIEFGTAFAAVFLLSIIGGFFRSDTANK